MLSGFKNLYSKSVDLIKQVQDQVVVKSQPGAAVPNIAPEKTHPGFHLVERFHSNSLHICCWCRTVLLAGSQEGMAYMPRLTRVSKRDTESLPSESDALTHVADKSNYGRRR